ncbi:putative dehydrogenase [Virgibacillus natechei]|uniref:Dehydrogenase n=1 Tax=Virgibacillus natechei TaxID=1216297 RepID=A0ABS4IEC7_9BACI|nr:Gfo/Idh/MocA family oxidoreductase [Virgibacillus natechei]MBP1969316.1 putative dehydrogenase [Virgibacillus natechei]UZD12469.1 Gfo/Idh/MocA family oxidoreductase [Virgibacillus natechei]
MGKIKVGVVGCGNISDIYFKNAKRFDVFDIVACADLELDRAREKAETFDIAKAYSTEALMADPEIDMVINLTIPSEHAKIALTALESGKHVYGEKPLAATREEAQQVLKLAKAKGLFVGNAPDTFLGGGLQTSRKLIDDGWIGDPVAATAFMMHHGHEVWHPNPDFFYKKGGGPMFDMGPYYITALLSLMGPVKRVTGSTTITFPERTITSKPKYGEKIKVETPSQINGVLDFYNGAVASIITSYDTWHHQLPKIEIHGTEGSLSVPDPNTFGGPVYLRRHDHDGWSDIPLTHGFTDNSRGLGVAEMAHAILAGKVPRAEGELAYHVLDIMQGFYDASETNQHYELASTCVQPTPLPVGINQENFKEKVGEW